MTVTDHDQITQLLARYARAVDTKDWALYRSVFTDDATIDYTSAGGESGNLDHIAKWMETTFGDLVVWSMHYITNIEVTPARDTAWVQAAFYNPMQFAGMPEPVYCGGWYEHEMLRTPSGWRSKYLHETTVWSTMKPSGAL